MCGLGGLGNGSNELGSRQIVIVSVWVETCLVGLRYPHAFSGHFSIRVICIRALLRIKTMFKIRRMVQAPIALLILLLLLRFEDQGTKYRVT